MVRQVLESQQMELVEKLSRGLAHEFKNLLTIILAYASLLETQVDVSLGEDLSKIRETVDRANELTSRLVSITRRPEPDVEDVDLADVLRETTGLLTKVLPTTVRVNEPEDLAMPLVRADHGALVRSLVHLCLNAGEAMPEGGTLTLEVEQIEVRSEDIPNYPVQEPGHYAVIGVADTGFGMSHSVLRHLYEPFYTTKRDGSGLGLCAVRQALLAMGGQISVYSEPGSGTCVRAYLPVAFVRPTSAAAAEATPRAGTILVADDDAATLTAARRAMERAGHRVYTAAGGVDALALFRKHAEHIDLVLLDVVMPDVSGNEVCRQMRETRAGVPVLVMSGFPRRTVEGTMGQADLRYLTKPFTQQALLDQVSSMLASR
jgi:CheY-like chemotaxis protein